MGFSVAPKEGPARVEGALHGAAAKAQEVRQRAIEAFTGGKPATPTPAQQQTTPVQNPNNVSPEELGAIRVPTQDNRLAAALDEKDRSNTTEAPGEATKEPQEQGQPLSAQLAQLARKEKLLRAKEIELKRREDTFRSQQAPPKAEPTLFDAAKHISAEELRSDPFAVLSKLGLTYNDLTERAANAPTPEQLQLQQTINALNAKISELEEGHKGVRKSMEDAEKASYETAMNTIRTDVKRLVYADERFETIKHSASEADVVELIEKTFHDGLGDQYPKGTVLTPEEAAQFVEDHLVEEAYNLVTKTKKLQGRLAPKAASAPTPELSKQQSPQQPQIRTLTNSVGTSRQYSAKERAMFAAQHGPNWREKVGA